MGQERAVLLKGSVLCPIRAIKLILDKVDRCPERHLFSYPNGNSYTYKQFHTQLRESLQKAGVTPSSGFSSHSLRRGRDKLLLVDDAVANFQIDGFRVVVMDRNEGLKEVTTDIHRAVLKLGRYKQVICVLGRSDVLRNRNFKTVLNKFVHVVVTFGKNTDVVITGPLPGFWDNKFQARDILEAAVVVKRRISNVPGFSFCDAAAWFADRNGIVNRLLCENGVTTEGARVLKNRMEKFL